jgi:hypothetical protein
MHALFFLSTETFNCSNRNEETPSILKSPPTIIRKSLDTGWQKRGNQKSYDSKTGTVHVHKFRTNFCELLSEAIYLLGDEFLL